MKKIINTYEKLVGKNISIYSGREKYDLCFKFIHLHHLLGLQYIKDDTIIKNTSPNRLKAKIENGIITYETLEKSKNFELIQSRVEHVYYFNNFLLSKNLVLYNSFKNSNEYTSNKFDFVVHDSSIKNENSVVFLGFIMDEKISKYVPVTFLVYPKKQIEQMQLMKIPVSKVTIY